MGRMTPSSDTTVYPATHPSLHQRLDGLRHALSEVMRPHVARCTVCRTELLPGDIAQGYCSDVEACCCRAFSARCW